MKKSNIKPRCIGTDEKGIKYYYAPSDNSYYKYLDGKFALIPTYDEYYDEDLKNLGFKEPVISEDLAIAKALEYRSNIKRIEKSRKAKIKVAIAAISLTGLLIGGSVEYTRAEANKPLSLQPDEVFEEYKDNFRSVIANNDTLDEETKEEIYFYVVRYLETMDPTANDLKVIESNIKYYVDYDLDRIKELGIIFNCESDAETYDLLEYLETCEPIDNKRLSY